MRDFNNIIASVDIGSNKVVVMIAEVLVDGRLEIIGIGNQPSFGMEKGSIVNIDGTVSSIQRALAEAERSAECKVHEVFVGMSGAHIRGTNSHGMVAIKEREVTTADIDQVVGTARAIQMPNDQQILHILGQDYKIDGQDGIKEPLSMSGKRLEVNVHIITAAVSAIENTGKCVRRCDLMPEDVMLSALAAAEACLTQDEKDLGVCLLDIGSGTMDLSVFVHGSIRHTVVIPIAGNHITQDIARAYQIPSREAEAIKQSHGCALTTLADANQKIELQSTQSRQRKPELLSVQHLAQTIESRVEEIFGFAQKELRFSGYQDHVSSIVITGGASLMTGMVELAEEIFHLPVRLGVPDYHGGLAEVVRSPKLSVATGLLFLGQKARTEQGLSGGSGGGLVGKFTRVLAWIKNSFS